MGVRKVYENFDKIPILYRFDREYMLDAIRERPQLIHRISKVLDFYDEALMLALEKDGNLLTDLGEYANKKKYVLIAVKSRGESIRYASIYLQNDYKVAFEAVCNDPKAIKYISKDLKNNRVIVEKALESNICYLNFAGITLKNDLEFILKYSTHKGCLIRYVGNKIKSNKQIAMNLVVSDPFNYRELNTTLRNDIEIIEKTLEQNILLFEHIPQKIITREFLLKWIKKCYGINIFKYASNDIKLDKDFILNNIDLLHPFLESSLCFQNKNFLLKVIKFNPFIYGFLYENIKRDNDIVSEVLKHRNDTMTIADCWPNKNFIFTTEHLYYITKNDKNKFEKIENSLKCHNIKMNKSKDVNNLLSPYFVDNGNFLYKNDFDIEFVYLTNKRKNEFEDENNKHIKIIKISLF